MLNRTIVYGLSIFSLALFGVAISTHQADAAQAKPPKTITYNGVTVSPAIVKVELQEGQPQAEFKIAVTNNTSQDVDLKVSTVDFRSLNTSGGVAFIDASSTQISNKYGLASWINLGVNQINLKPKQVQIIPMTVQNRSDLAPGGHYAAILFKGDKASSNKGETHVSINQVVSSLIFVRKLGGEKFGIALKKPSIPTSWFRLPTNINLEFKNTGNIQEVPYGLVRITDPLGKEVKRGQINTDSSLILPESTRIYRTPLFKTSSSWLGGMYKVNIEYHSDGVKNTQYLTTSFFYFNFRFLALAIIIILVFGIVVRKSPKLLRWVKQKRK